MVAGHYGSVATLRKRSEFLTVQTHGRRSKGRHVVVLCLSQTIETRLDTPRLGITVSKRVGNAVTRNRVRRRLRELFRTGRAELPQGCDVVVVAYPSASAVDARVLEADLRRTLRRFG